MENEHTQPIKNDGLVCVHCGCATKELVLFSSTSRWCPTCEGGTQQTIPTVGTPRPNVLGDFDDLFDKAFGIGKYAVPSIKYSYRSSPTSFGVSEDEQAYMECHMYHASSCSCYLNTTKEKK